jgi:hypothetical protein
MITNWASSWFSHLLLSLARAGRTRLQSLLTTHAVRAESNLQARNNSRLQNSTTVFAHDSAGTLDELMTLPDAYVRRCNTPLYPFSDFGRHAVIWLAVSRFTRPLLVGFQHRVHFSNQHPAFFGSTSSSLAKMRLTGRQKLSPQPSVPIAGRFRTSVLHTEPSPRWARRKDV